MSEISKKVLIVTYYFPPSGGVGVQRTLKFVKYLPQFGWEPVVLTAADADYPVLDRTLLEEIPSSIQVYRSRIMEPYKLYRWLTRRKASDFTDIVTLSSDDDGRSGLGERFAELIRSGLFVPDARIGWFPFAVSMGKKILRTQKISAIFSSAPPYTTHLIARRLKRHSKLPWLADFRDSWIGWFSTPQWRPFYARNLEKHMESAVLNEADKILTVSMGVRRDLSSRHEISDFEKWEILYNGFDPDDFRDLRPDEKSGKTIITYVGSMDDHRNPEFLIRAMESIEENTPARLDGFCLRVVGRLGDRIKKRIESSQVAGYFEFVPYVPHQKGLAYLTATDVSLLIIEEAPANHAILTGKLFEYVGAGKPILALVPEGDAADLIRTEKLGWVVPPTDTDAICTALQEILARNFNGNRDFSAVQSKFNRREQTMRLAEILDSLSEDGDSV